MNRKRRKSENKEIYVYFIFKSCLLLKNVLFPFKDRKNIDLIIHRKIFFFYFYVTKNKYFDPKCFVSK